MVVDAGSKTFGLVPHELVNGRGLYSDLRCAPRLIVPARPLLVLALLVPTLATAGMAQTRCAIYFGLEQADARLTKLVGNRPQMLKADVVSPWPAGVDTTTEVGAVTVVKGVPSTSTLPSIVSATPPTTLTLQSWPLPKKEIENLKA